MSPPISRRGFCALGLAAALPARLAAAPIRYVLDTSRSTVGFGVDLAGQTFTGSMPVASADLALDFATLRNSRIAVTLDAARARMGFALATDAMRGPDLLDTARHPVIAFRSTAVQPTDDPARATVSGDVTIRGITGPVTVAAVLTQDRATLGQDNPELVFILQGRVNREMFRITAYKGLVGPMVSLDIRASIRRG